MLDPVRRAQAALYGSPRWESVRGPAARRALVIGHVTLGLAAGAARWLDPRAVAAQWATLVLLGVSLVSGVVLAAATHGVTEVDRSLLDERQVQVQKHAHRVAYRMFGAVAGVVLVVVAVATRHGTLHRPQVDAVVWVLAMTFAGLPAATAAWPGGGPARR